ncbi:dihydroxyacetone kinase subunit DhaK [Amycolatopsis endophytica]|uniref:Dihydroxyacetone kinase n=1 Tax=Amycolatopsis endophytica TaxID=860233 RepID=A0A853BDJ0_9PSEU|nr:dihydroxyacetone kinase subunit DhaK [Amycolatopsis endophytica]NYI92752.1 dihydroxyacetone kinase [Amycolatopsis endophytica]
MKKLINQPGAFVDEVISSIVDVHPELRTSPASKRVVTRTGGTPPGQVGIVTGGGFGHLPLFLGYVGGGLCAAAAVGNVFSSPSSEEMLIATREADSGAGVLHLYGNYGGDVLNFELAAEDAAAEGIAVRTVLGTDDVFSAALPEDRRGVAGLALVCKIAGAAAARGDSLDQVAAIAQRAADHTRTAGVGLSPTYLPTTGKPTFTLADDEMEIGVGIHGEPGSERITIETADAVADRLMDAIFADAAPAAGDRVALLVNGLGATPAEELYLLTARARARLHKQNVTVAHTYVGHYATSLEMAGASVTVTTLGDDLAPLIAAPAHSPLVRF